MAVAVATREVFAPIPGTAEIWDVDAEVAKGTAITNNGRSGVALGNSGGHTFSKTVQGITISGPDGAAGYNALQVGVETTGTFEFDAITGVTASTETGTLVYIDSTGALTTTSTSNTLFGSVNYPQGYAKATALAPVKIGG